MRILLAASASYDPPKGGSTRSNLLWLRAMAANGHHCLVLCGGDENHEADREGIRIRTIQAFSRRAHLIGEAVVDFQPDFVLVSSEDLSHSLLREAHSAARDRLIYLAHTPQWFPFGPEAWHKDTAATELLKDALAIVSIGEHMAGYIERHLGRKAAVVPPAMYGEPPWPEYSNFDQRTALLINPCTVKGLPIFLDLASRFPDIHFLALRGWGTTSSDLAALQALPNVEVLDTVANIDEVFSRTSVLLAPSLWYEGFGLVVTESLIRGIPVLASNHGGLTEAAFSSRNLLPVSPIRHWHVHYDETGMPVPYVDPQPLTVWQTALSKLLDHRETYDAERSLTMSAARKFASKLKPTDLESLLASLKPRPLNILLIHNSTYYPGSGGGDKSNRLLVDALGKEGHKLRVFTRLEQFGEVPHQLFVEELKGRGLESTPWNSFGIAFRLSGAEVHVVTRETNLRRALADDLADFKPDIILCSTDDPAHLFYEIALQFASAKVVYLVRATIALPFGPDASTISPERTERLRQADSIVCVSEYVARYCRDHGNLDAIHVPISLGDHADPPMVGSHSNPYVTLVNPSAVKGLPILLGLADLMPDTKFAAVPSWGTTAADLEAIKKRPNITLIDPVDDITELLRQTRLTLVPSLWAEARSRMVVESLSRGVPVLAARVGGLQEAMCGVDFVLPVNPIVRYESKVSDQMVPEAEVPPQDLSPWLAALKHLLEDSSAWKELSSRSRTAALEYLSGLTVKPLEAVLRKSLSHRRQRAEISASSLSPIKRKLLALRIAKVQELKRKRAFPVQWGEGPKVFLFPWAAAGVQAWNFLVGEAGLRYIPALLPGREDRMGEAPPRSFEELIPALTRELAQLIEVGEPFVLAGHSMGGGLAFEVARELRRRQLPMPAGLLLSSCTAPSVRNTSANSIHASDLLGSDRAMFGSHIYQAEPPLAIPITVMKGEEAINSEAWQKETTEEFRALSVNGDHFWLWNSPKAFADELRRLHRIL